MNRTAPIIVRDLPERQSKLQRCLFLDEIKALVGETYRPRLVLDLSSCKIKAETIDLLLECVEEVEHADGRVSVAAPNPEAAVILELTQLTSVLDMFPSVLEAEVGSALTPMPARSDHGSEMAA